MGFFSDIVSESRRGMSGKQDPVPVRQIDMRPPAAPGPASIPETRPAANTLPAAPKPESAPPAAAPAARPEPAPETAPAPAPIPGTSAPAPAAPVPEPASVPADVPAEPEPEPVAAPEPPKQQPEPPSLDLSADADAADEAERKRAHEAAEAKRKADFDAKQAAKKAARQEQLDWIKAMNDAELLEAATGRVAADTEKLTRRNMKEAVAEHIQAKCREDAAFARLVMAPEKSMINCFKYINRKAREYAEQEMKDLGIKRTGTYGCDVPDGLCYGWAEDYFKDPDAEEDRKDDEKFVPKPYVPNRKASKAAAAKKKKPEKKPTSGNAKAPEKPKTPELEQMSLM